MKKLCAACFAVFLLASCYSSAGITGNAEFELGHSAHFTRDEIQCAANVVMGTFSSFHGCELTRLWYNEELSEREIKRYSSMREASENHIVLFSDFYVGLAGAGGFSPGTTYTNWTWLLKRNDQNDIWQVVGYGYA